VEVFGMRKLLMFLWLVWLLGDVFGCPGPISENPCKSPNMCEEKHRACEIQGGQAVCTTCLAGYEEKAEACIPASPSAAREVTSAAGRVQGGGYTLDVQLGHPIPPYSVTGSGTRVEGAPAVAP
jgi:hypothetical protein